MRQLRIIICKVGSNLISGQGGRKRLIKNWSRYVKGQLQVVFTSFVVQTVENNAKETWKLIGFNKI